jgi:hypothetical protein
MVTAVEAPAPAVEVPETVTAVETVAAVEAPAPVVEAVAAVEAATPAPTPVRERRVDVRHADANDVDDEPTVIEMDDLRIAVGRRDGLRSGELVRFLREKAGLSRRDVGRVSMRDRFTLVGIRADRLDDVIDAIGDATYADRPLAPERGRGAEVEAPEGELPEINPSSAG